MIRAVIFDMFETLISYHTCPVYFGTQMAEDAGIPVAEFLSKWRATDYERSTGKRTVDEVLEQIGHPVGGVCPFGIKPGVPVYLDESLKRFDIVYPAAGTGNSAVKLTIDELFTCSEAVGWVDVCKLPEV